MVFWEHGKVEIFPFRYCHCDASYDTLCIGAERTVLCWTKAPASIGLIMWLYIMISNDKTSFPRPQVLS